MASIIPVGASWRATVRRKGHPQQNKTFPTKKAAQDWATSIEAKIIEGAPIHNTGLTVCDLIDKYRSLREHSNPIKHGCNTEYMLRHLDQGLGELVASKMTVEDVTKWVQYRLDHNGGIGKLALGQELVLLKTVFKLGCAYLNITLPDTVGSALIILKGLGMIKATAKARERRLEDDEEQRLLGALSPQMQDIFRVAATLGLRRGEILKLAWSDLDKKKKMIWVRNRKDPKDKIGNDDNIPLVLGSYEVLMRQPKTSKLVFPGILGEHVSDQFLAACRACDIEGLHFHDLRHEAISRLFEAGLTIENVALVSGHKDWRNLRRYANLKPGNVHALLGTDLT